MFPQQSFLPSGGDHQDWVDTEFESTSYKASANQDSLPNHKTDGTYTRLEGQDYTQMYR